ncbi:DEAD/DEAH box helicase [Pseudooceanicola sediminis]|uniref:DEAD/DEAH box helicase n=1 Tax=Pseudooceanicola sediminis TaxID=2211117 RepID=A0A399J3D8_9RHOB|nr:DEAD/DEAH box helicase [Pseudooceanicola sediminis]KAA2317428.1 DEAD/DEAH box helicase [Puniceibacterium sp. HSS470]RII39780.1 DEAD/DEAH box helicase [Pseudooceanicola sediminis]|tara:strand:+ start:5694 stop:7955 length:2262 start_codon:yes stop_codon:yes gene_type:complete
MISSLSDALAERGYDSLTPVQEAVTAPELQDADLLVSAQTGSGKTVGFGLAIGHTLLGEEYRLAPPAAPLALIIAPTRELALQVMRELAWLYAKAGVRMASCVGGMDMREERRNLERGAHIVVGTPGRLVDHIKRRSLDMNSLRAVVLDEADEMLDLGFREDLEFMLGEAPEDRRTLMFSATVPPMIANLAKQFQRDAVRVNTATSGKQHSDITYQALRVAAADGENAIINTLRYHDAENAIVFANTRAAVNRLTARFSNRGFSVVCLSGELSQNERTHALQAMRDGRARVCVATDVAARGIDLPNLELVIHADLPTNAEALLHRSGRTGRAGRKGTSALIVGPRDVKKAERLLKWAKINAEWTAAPSAEEILRRDEERLLTDPAWDEDISEDTATFAAKLLEQHSPEKIAAAYLRLYRARQSAPEELGNPDERPARAERGERADRVPFGPSKWFALSVGRDNKAEARWLLPLLCRSGNLTKESIGAIRVQDSETYVEILESSAPGFLNAIGAAHELEDGVGVRPMDEAPPRPNRGPSYDKPKFDKPKFDKPKFDKPKSDKPKYDKPREEKAAYDAPKAAKPAAAEAPVPQAPRPDAEPRTEPRSEKRAFEKVPYSADRKPAAKPGGFKKPKPHVAGDLPGVSKYSGKPAGSKPAGGKPAGGKPAGGKPAGKFGKSDGKSFSKPAGKPYGKSSEGKSDGPAKPRFSASDPSQRVTRPGAKPFGKPGGKAGGKPGGKPRSAKQGGSTPPRRTKD